jgi:hypothetical protein
VHIPDFAPTQDILDDCLRKAKGNRFCRRCCGRRARATRRGV